MASQGVDVFDEAVDIVSTFSMVQDQLYVIQNKSDYRLYMYADDATPDETSAAVIKATQFVESNGSAQVTYGGTDNIYVWYPDPEDFGVVSIVEAA